MSDQPFISEFSPDIIGANRFKVTLDPSTTEPRAGAAVILNIDYSAADADGGVVRPVEVIVQAPSPDGYLRRVYRRFSPKAVVVFPLSGGQHMVMVRETGHNLFFGALVFDVAGDPIEQVAERRGPVS